MNRGGEWRLGLAFVVVALVSCDALAKKVICIDDVNDAFTNNHEGYERALGLGAMDILQRGGSLMDCLAMVANGDELVIIAHGNGMGTGFMWGGMTYTGFGPGPGQYPVPPGFAGHMNVSVRFCTCWSMRDPDGPGGTNVPLTTKIVAALGGAGNNNTAQGYNDLARANVHFVVCGGTAAQRQAAINCLESNMAWQSNPPANRPGTGGAGQPGNQQTAAQMQLNNNCPGAGGAVTVKIPNQVAMVNGQGQPTTGGYRPPFNSQNRPAPGDASRGVCGCACPDVPPFCGCGDGFGVDGGDAAIPTVSELGLVVLGGTFLVLGGVAARRFGVFG